MQNRPKVGVAALIIKDSKILLGKRRNMHGDGTWASPGGHLEFGEDFESCAKRETLEETGIEILKMRRFGFTNDVFIEEGKHYVTIFMLVEQFNGVPQTLEPDKCEYWQWFGFDELPDNLFLPLRNVIKQEVLFFHSAQFKIDKTSLNAI